jgi:hypothetical protein
MVIKSTPEKKASGKNKLADISKSIIKIYYNHEDGFENKYLHDEKVQQSIHAFTAKIPKEIELLRQEIEHSNNEAVQKRLYFSFQKMNIQHLLKTIFPENAAMQDDLCDILSQVVLELHNDEVLPNEIVYNTFFQCRLLYQIIQKKFPYSLKEKELGDYNDYLINYFNVLEEQICLLIELKTIKAILNSLKV